MKAMSIKAPRSFLSHCVIRGAHVGNAYMLHISALQGHPDRGWSEAVKKCLNIRLRGIWWQLGKSDGPQSILLILAVREIPLLFQRLFRIVGLFEKTAQASYSVLIEVLENGSVLLEQLQKFRSATEDICDASVKTLQL